MINKNLTFCMICHAPLQQTKTTLDNLDIRSCLMKDHAFTVKYNCDDMQPHSQYLRLSSDSGSIYLILWQNNKTNIRYLNNDWVTTPSCEIDIEKYLELDFANPQNIMNKLDAYSFYK